MPTLSPTLSPVAKIATNAPVAPPGPTNSYEVESMMVLYGIGDELDGDAIDSWVFVTQGRIYDETLKTIDGQGNDLVVAVSLDHQEAVESGRRARMSLRSLQSSESGLQINFTTAIGFNSDKQSWDPNAMVADGFRTTTQQWEYIVALKSADDAFANVDSMMMEVEGEVITETKDSNELETTNGNDKTAYYIIGGVLGGTLLILIILAGVHYERRKQRIRRAESERRKSQSSSSSLRKQSSSLPQDKPVSVSRGVSSSSQPPPPAVTPPQNYFGTIEPSNAEDDVSTLGDPYFGEGVVNLEPRADETVAESMMSSENEMYVFGVGRPRTLTGGDSTVRGSTTTPNKMLLVDDTTLEDAYRNTDNASYGGETSGSSNFRRLTVVAPSGKLGIVIDNQTGDMPVVHAIKETSVLHGRVNVGDFLMSVDEVDTRGMSAVQVSKLISSRSQNPSRKLVLMRGSGGGGASML